MNTLISDLEPQRKWTNEPWRPGDDAEPAPKNPHPERIYRPEVLKTIEQKICELSDELRALSLDIHAHPELGFEEHYAHAAYTKFMKAHGWNVKEHHHLETAWEATFECGQGGRVIGVNSEMDALKGIGHACGHNLIGIAGVAISLGLRAAMEKHDIPGKIVLLGTPAEEGLDGKVKLLNKGAYEDMDVCLIYYLRRLDLKLSIPPRSPHQPEDLQRDLRWWKESKTVINMSYPSLDDLCVSIIDRDDKNDLLLWQLGKSAIQVKSLTVQSVMSQANVLSLTRLYTRSRQLNRLQTLTLSFKTFTPAMLGLLATGLPELKALYLSCAYIGLCEDPHPRSVEQAHQGFAELSYPGWALEEFFLHDYCPRTDNQGEAYRNAFLLALPSVKYFNGLPREEYLEKGRPWY